MANGRARTAAPRDQRGRFVARQAVEQPAADQPGEPVDAAELIEELRAAMLQRMKVMVAALPGGYYTEIKGQLAGADGAPLVGTWKMRDFAASLKDLAAIGKGVGGPEVEDWSPLAGIFGGGDEDEEEESGD